jgi:hypothetical protein
MQDKHNFIITLRVTKVDNNILNQIKQKIDIKEIIICISGNRVRVRILATIYGVIWNHSHVGFSTCVEALVYQPESKCWM